MSLNLQNVSLRISAGFPSQFPADPIPQIALSGRSNVGKSSLTNTLLGRKSLARVSSAPGKTVTVNFYDIDRKFFLVDLPGYGFARRPKDEQAKWASLTDGYFTKNPNRDRLALVLQLIDSRAGITADDEMMLSYLTDAEIPFAVVVTKIDKPNKTERAALLSSLASDPRIPEGTPILPFSSLSGEGREDVWRTVSTYTGVKR